MTVLKRRGRAEPYLIGECAFGDQARLASLHWSTRSADCWLDRFPPDPDDDSNGDRLTPRLSVDEWDALRVRAANLDAAVSFLGSFFRHGALPAASRNEQIPGGRYTVQIRSADHFASKHRAVAKTATNFAAKVLGPACVRAAAFSKLRDYCLNGVGDDDGRPFVGTVAPPWQSFFSEDDPAFHRIMLAANGDRLVCLIQLYSAVIYRVHFGRGTALHAKFERKWRVDYNGSGIIELSQGCPGAIQSKSAAAAAAKDTK